MSMVLTKRSGIQISFIVLLLMVAPPAGIELWSQNNQREVSIVDTFHYSSIFGDTRNYRIFFPPGYDPRADKRYPVIYFFHGWAQRYFGEMGEGYSHYDSGDDNNGDNMEAFVGKRDVIIVKIDGSNQFPSESLELTPWNIGTVKSFRQFPIYFEELVHHIDQSYQTISDRQHRAVSGLSMGGFMTFWVSGKFPHLISGAGNFCGSFEFKIGPYEFPVEYSHVDMYDNYKGVNVYMHYGTRDKLRYYHQDLNKIWPQVIDNYQCRTYDASHITCGLGDMFESLYQSFISPLPVPETWHHIDVYPNFDIWGYSVTSDRIRPGFTVLKNVNKRGFRTAVRSHLPDGEMMSDVNLEMRSPPIYKENTSYLICDYDVRTGVHKEYLIDTDSEGTINISVDGSEHHIGINEIQDAPNISIFSMHTENIDWLQAEREVDLSIKLINKGQSTAENISMNLTASRSNVEVKKDNATLDQIKSGQVVEKKGAFVIHVPSDTVEIVRLLLTIKDQVGNIWTDHFDLKVRNDENNLEGELVVADGSVMTVVCEAVDSVTEKIGMGNGDGIPNPGESIVLLIRNKGKLYRTTAFTKDQYINPNGINLRTSDSWQNYEHIGPSAKFTTTIIDPKCPDGRLVNFWLEYWLPNLPEHIIKRGTVKVKVVGSADKTAPVFKWLQIKNSKKFEVSAYDASKISKVEIRMIPDEEASTIKYVRWEKPEGFEFRLHDDGHHGDNAGGDSIFTGIIEGKDSYIYRAKILLTDMAGNNTTHTYAKPIFIQDLTK